MNLPSKLNRRQAHRLVWAAALAAVGADRAGAALSPSAPAPDFTLRSMAGSNLRLAEQRGSVVLVNFWATWCGPCREEMPHLNRLYDKYRGSGLQLLGVNVDDDAKNAIGMAQKMGVRFPVLLDTDKAVSRSFDVSAMPSTVLIDRDGKVRHVHRGYKAGVEDTYERLVRDLLKE
jgi:peroxiredoxin